MRTKWDDRDKNKRDLGLRILEWESMRFGIGNFGESDTIDRLRNRNKNK